MKTEPDSNRTRGQTVIAECRKRMADYTPEQRRHLNEIAKRVFRRP